jgi:hypothetical protein
MNIPQATHLDQTSAEDLLRDAKSRDFILQYLPSKHQLVIESGQDWLARLFLPWTLDWNAQNGFLPKPDSHFALVLIRAGQAAVGYFHQGALIDHKVFRAYMTRQKQGKSQIKHLKTRGKSRAGSRIRLAESERFFEEINERLKSYSQSYPIDFWGISCAKTLWPHFFSSEISPPFSPKEKSLIELPVHIAQASFEELKALGNLLAKFHLIRSDLGEQIFPNPTSGGLDLDLDETW